MKPGAAVQSQTIALSQRTVSRTVSWPDTLSASEYLLHP